MFEITMDGPGKNAMGTSLLEGLLGRLDEAGGRPVLLTGAGDAFSAGLNLKEVSSFDAPAMDRFLRLLERCMSAFYLYPGPTVAAVNGHAIAGGAVITLACDHRVATADARVRIGLNEVAIGVRYPPRVFRIVRDRLPRASLERVVLGADLFPPAVARELGLVDEVAEDVVGVARARLERLASHPALAYADAKRALRGALPQDLVSDAEEEAWLDDAGLMWTSPAVKERLLAVLRR
jgi:enoyl-CoA hydratase/carnithine racemase